MKKTGCSIILVGSILFLFVLWLSGCTVPTGPLLQSYTLIPNESQMKDTFVSSIGTFDNFDGFPQLAAGTLWDSSSSIFNLGFCLVGYHRYRPGLA